MGVSHERDAAGPWNMLVPLFTVRHSVVANAAAANLDGHLVVAFDDGATLRAGPGEHYENWEMVGPRGLLLVATAKGGLAVFGDIEQASDERP